MTTNEATFMATFFHILHTRDVFFMPEVVYHGDATFMCWRFSENESEEFFIQCKDNKFGIMRTTDNRQNIALWESNVDPLTAAKAFVTFLEDIGAV